MLPIKVLVEKSTVPGESRRSMKRINNLFEKITCIENLRLAHKNARREKRHYREVQEIDNHEDEYLQKLQKLLVDKTFKNSPYKTFKKREKGKERQIFKLPYFPDRIIHHAILQVLEPVWKPVLIKDTYQSIKGRGIHSCKNRIEKVLRSNRGMYCLKIDIKKYYPSIDNSILKQTIRKKIKDHDVLWLLDEIIDSTTGVPIGNYLSQYLGNLYLSYYDHWLKEKMKIAHYFRYCDDMIIMHHDKDFLQYLFVKIEHYLKKHLKLTVKANWQIFPIYKRRIDFLGFRFDHEKTYIRKSIVKAFKNKVAHLDNTHHSQRSIMSYYGWVKATHSHCLWDKYWPEIKTKIA